MIRVLWVDKDTGLSLSSAFSWHEHARVEAAWLRTNGHENVRVVQSHAPN
jgi:hypothetical protein